MAPSRGLAVLVLICGLSSAVFSQSPNLEPNTPGDKPAPTITFDLVFPGAMPSHYSVSVESTGRAAYRSDEMGTQETKELSTGQPYLEEFTISDTNRTRIFRLAAEANYFRGNFDYTRHRVANTGTKTLTYSEGPSDSFGKPTKGVRNQTVYNYSENPAIQQLTAIFDGISNTFQLGQRLAYLRRFDKLGLDAELKRAEELAQEGRLQELQAIAPTLRQVAEDDGVLHIARQRAQHLLRLAEASPAATASH